MVRRTRGFTLIEILVVLSLLAVLMGLGVGFLQAMGQGNVLVQTTHSFANLLATARASAYGSSTSYVTVEADERGNLKMRVYRNRPVFHWPCEDMERASSDGVLAPTGVSIAGAGAAGREGRYAEIPKGAQVSLGNQAWLQFRDGFSVQCRVRPDAGGGRLFKMGDALEVRLVPGTGGRLGVEARVRLDKDAKGEGSGDYVVRTGYRESDDEDKMVTEWQAPLIPGRWHDLRVAYDRNSFTIQVDGRMRAVLSERHNRMKPETIQPFLVGGGYTGGFDSLLVSGIFEDDQDKVDGPDGVVWLDDKDATKIGTGLNIHFKNRSLDPHYHTGPIRFVFRLDVGADKDRGARRIVDIAMSGESFVRSPQEVP